ncbi:MAG: WHG domain-containing protein [Polyangiaceae bacterium]
MPRRARQEPRAYHHGNLRRELLDAALRVFAERGTLDFTLRELARAAGVTHSAPYRHFASKGELVSALQEEVFERLGQRERAALATSADDPRARVKALGEAYVRFAIAEPVAFRLVLAHPIPEEGSAPRGAGSVRGREAFTLLLDALDAARDAGAARSDLSARELALVAWSLVHGLASLVSSGRVPVSEARVRRYADLLDTVFFEGARPPR